MMAPISPPIRCAPEGQITVDFGRHRLTVDGRLELESLAHYYLAHWLSLVEETLVEPPPGYPDAARFSLTPERLALPVRPADAYAVSQTLAALFAPASWCRHDGNDASESARITTSEYDRAR